MFLIRFIGKVIALVLLIAFILILPVSLWVFNVQSILFSRPALEAILEDPIIFNEALPSLTTAIVQQVAASDDAEVRAEAWYARELFANIPPDSTEQVGNQLLSTAWLETQVRYNLGAVFDWVDGPGVVPHFRWELGDMKARLGGSEGQGVVESVVGRWPDCSPEQEVAIQAFLTSVVSGSNSLPACQPRDSELRERLIEKINTSMAFIGDEIPEVLPEEERLAELTEQERAEWLNLKLALRVFNRIAYLIFLVPLILILLIEIITVRSFKSLFIWLGWGLLPAGLIALLILIDITPLALLNTLNGQAAVDPVSLQTAVIVLSVVRQISNDVLLQGGIITGVGLALILLGILIPDRQSSDQTEQDMVYESR